MILTCPQCSTRLQLETTKLPTRPFSVKCPKCQNAISVTPPEVATGEAATTATSAATTAPATVPRMAPLEEKAPRMAAEATPIMGAMMEQDPMKALAAMFASAFNQNNKPASGEPVRRRRMLVCLSLEEELQKIQAVLQGHDYDLTFITSSEQAIDMLQLSNQVDMILLDPNFEDDQGGGSILRFINSLSPNRRRRLYVTLIGSSYKTLDTHAAFVNGVNLLINSSEIPMLPHALNKGIREFNLLYRAYNEASDVGPF